MKYIGYIIICLFLLLSGVAYSAENLEDIYAMVNKSELIQAEEALKQININDLDADQLAYFYALNAFLYEKMEKYDVSIEWGLKAAEQYQKITVPDFSKVATIYITLAKFNERLNKYDEAIESYKKALVIYESGVLPARETLINSSKTYNEIARIFENGKKYSDAEEYYNKDASAKEKAYGKYSQEVIKVYSVLGSMFSDAGNNDKQIFYFNKSIFNGSKLTNDELDHNAMAYQLIGFAYEDSGNLDKAVEYTIKALDTAYKIKPVNNKLIADYATEAGRIFNKQGKNDDAMIYFIKALEILEKQADPPEDLVKIYQWVAQDFDFKENYQENFKWYEKALSYYQKKPDKYEEDIARVLFNTGMLYKRQKKLEDALTYFKMSNEHYENKFGSDHEEVAATSLKIAETLLDAGEFNESLKWFDKAIKIYDKKQDKGHLALCYNNLAAAYDKLSQYYKAQEYYLKVLTLYNNSENIYTAASLNNIGLIYQKQGKLDLALNYLNKALNAYVNDIGDKNNYVISVYNNIGMVNNDLASYEEATQYCKNSITLIQELYGQDSVNLAEPYSILANIYTNKNDFVSSIDYYNKSIALQEKYLDKNDPALIATYNNIAAYYTLLNDYNLSLDYYMKALNIIDKLPEKDKLKTAYLYKNIGIVYSGLGKYSEAMEWLNKSLPLFIELFGNEHIETINNKKELASCYDGDDKYDEAINIMKDVILLQQKKLLPDNPELAMSYNNLAGIYMHKDDYGTALKLLEDALTIQKKKFGMNHLHTASTLNHIAVIYTLMGRYDEANKIYYDLIKVYNNTMGENNVQVATIYNDIGVVYLAKKQYNKAIEYFKKALRVIEKRQLQYTMAEYNFNIGTALMMTGQNVEAMNYFDKSIKLLEEFRDYSSSENDRFKVSTKLLTYFEAAIDCALSLNAVKTAFNYCERVKTRNLINAISAQQAKYSAGISKEDLEKVNTLEYSTGKLFNDYKNLINSKGAKNSIIESENKYITERNRLNEFKKILDGKYPEYYQLRFPQPASYEKFTEVIKNRNLDDTAFIQYFIGKNKVYIWLLTDKGLSYFVSPIKKEELNKLLASVIKNCKEPVYSTELLNNLSGLYKVLIAPLKNDLKNSDGTYKYNKLVIIPHGYLYYVPFESLIENDNYKTIDNIENKASELKNLDFLIKSFSISYLGSLSLWDERNSKAASKSQNELLIIANPYPDHRVRKYSFPMLPAAEDEGKSLKELYKEKADILIQKEATEKELAGLSGKYSNYHFATHGIVDSKDPYMSAIMLSRGDKVTDEEEENGLDGILYAYELIDRNLAADTIVLSACETGKGKVIEGEGLLGLSRALMISGAKSFMVSLWQVDDKATSKFMTDFYSQKTSTGKTEAARKAKLDLINYSDESKRVYAHPFYWSPFVLYGEWK